MTNPHHECGQVIVGEDGTVAASDRFRDRLDVPICKMSKANA